jgi:hypothetical protein
MRQPHSKHRGTITVRYPGGKCLMTCHYRNCAATWIVDRVGDKQKADRRDAKILKAGRRIFAPLLEGVQDLGL